MGAVTSAFGSKPQDSKSMSPWLFGNGGQFVKQLLALRYSVRRQCTSVRSVMSSVDNAVHFSLRA
jgi:hypothetical protein